MWRGTWQRPGYSMSSAGQPKQIIEGIANHCQTDLASQPHQTRLLTRPGAGHIIHSVIRDSVTRVADLLLVTHLLTCLSPEPHLTLPGPGHLPHTRHLHLVRGLEVAGVGLGRELARVPGPVSTILPLPALCLAVLCTLDVSDLLKIKP